MECVSAAAIILLREPGRHGRGMKPQDIAAMADTEKLANSAIDRHWRQPYFELHRHREFETRPSGHYGLSEYGERKARFLAGVLALMHDAADPMTDRAVSRQVLEQLQITGSAEWFQDLRNDRLLREAVAGYTLTSHGQDAARLVTQWFPAICSRLRLAATAVIKAYGIRWRRAAVNWNGENTRLYGQPAADGVPRAIDYNGVYVLYRDGIDAPAYVGQTTRRLAQRLDQHTRNDKSEQWDAFSWFGITPANRDDDDAGAQFSPYDLINALEAILIAVNAPDLNAAGGVLLGDRWEQYAGGAIL